MKLTLHIGLHKTGSTYIQNSLYNNYSPLLKEKLLFPKTGFVDLKERGGTENTSAGHDLFVKAALSNDIKFRRKILTALENEISNTNPEHIFISAENFTNHLLGDISKETHALFNNIENTKILIFLRNPYEWIESYYRDRVTSGWEFERNTLKKFIKKHKIALEYHTMIERWGKTFGLENIDVIIYGKSLREKGILTAFKDYAQISAELVQTKNNLTNESPSLNFFNSALNFNRKILPTKSARIVLTEFKNEGYAKGPKGSLLRQCELDLIEQIFIKYNKNIPSFHIVDGDLKDIYNKPNKNKHIDEDSEFSDKMIQRYKEKKKNTLELLTGFAKLFHTYLPIKIQIFTRKFIIRHKKNSYKI